MTKSPDKDLHNVVDSTWDPIRNYMCDRHTDYLWIVYMIFILRDKYNGLLSLPCHMKQSCVKSDALFGRCIAWSERTPPNSVFNMVYNAVQCVTLLYTCWRKPRLKYFASCSADYEKTKDWSRCGTAQGKDSQHLFFLCWCQEHPQKCKLWVMVVPLCYGLSNSLTSSASLSPTEQTRWTPSKEEKCSSRGHLWGLWCWWRFPIGIDQLHFPPPPSFIESVLL